ncbi:acyl-CoA dehydrogenase family protein [Acetobacter senegalensis]|nr:acyl-CoA dehydrogenase family protein [Acetobacter senegalensis]
MSGKSTDVMIAPRKQRVQSYPADHYLALARDLADRFAVDAAGYDRSGACPERNLDLLFESGLMAVTIAPEAGGAGGGLQLARAIVSEIARGEPATALILAMYYGTHGQIARGSQWPEALGNFVVRDALSHRALINAAQVEPETGSPSHGGVPRTVARRQGDGWRITGHKCYCTGSTALRWILISAVTDEVQPRIASFLVPADASGVSFRPAWDTTGMRATASHDVILDNVEVPYGHILHDRPAGAPLVREAVGTVWHFTLVASVYHGVTLAARDWLVKFGRERRLNATGDSTLFGLPHFQEGLGRAEILIQTNERLLRATAREADEGRPEALEGALLRHATTESQLALHALFLELTGAVGLSRHDALERYCRDLACVQSHAPNSRAIRLMVARSAFPSDEDQTTNHLKN